MTDTQTQGREGLLAVTQADREAAAEYISHAFGEQYRHSVLNEERWPDLVLAFARHRLSALTPQPVPEGRALVPREATEGKTTGELNSDLSPDDCRMAGMELAAAAQLGAWSADFIPQLIAELERDPEISTADICKVFRAMKQVLAAAPSLPAPPETGL